MSSNGMQVQDSWHHLNDCSEPSYVFRASSNIYPYIFRGWRNQAKPNVMPVYSKGTRLASTERRQNPCMTKGDHALSFPSHITSPKKSCNLDS